MFFSKLWFLLLTLVAALAVMLVLTQPRRWQRALDAQVRARLETAHPAARQLLQLHARKWLDAAAQASQDAVLAEALDYAARETNDPGLLHHTVQERLQQFQGVWRANLVMALDVRGRVVGRVGFGEEEWGEDLSRYPAVGEALHGWRLDDTWEFGGKLYRVCLAPIIGPSQRYVGVLLIGLELGSELATVLREQLGLEVAFVVDGRMSGQSASLPRLPELLPFVVEQRTRLGSEEASGVLSLSSREPGSGRGASSDRRYGAVLLALGGEASGRGAVCVLLGERGRMPTLLEQVRGLGWLQIGREETMMVAGGVGGVLAVFFLLMAMERHGRVRRLVRDVKRLRGGKLARIEEKRYVGAVRALARSINEIGEMGTVERGALVPQGTEVPGPEPAGEAAPAAVASAAVPVAIPDGKEEKTKEEKTKEAKTKEAKEEKTREKVGPVVSPPLAAGAPMGGTAVPLIPRPPEAPSGRRRVVPVAPAASGHAGHAGVSGVHGGRPQRSVPRREALAALAIGEALGLEGGPEPGEKEYQAVYQEFVAAKRSLGESLEGLSFDRFVEKLQQNRAELIQRNSCRTVKFSVYIKDGRAAIRATPMYG